MKVYHSNGIKYYKNIILKRICVTIPSY